MARMPPRLALVVDPERSIRAAVRSALEIRGYEVVEAGHPHDALVMFHANPGIGVVVADLVLPELDGRSLMTHLRRRRPDLPILLLASREGEVVDVATPEAGGTGVLVKPVTPQRLADALVRLLPEDGQRR